MPTKDAEKKDTSLGNYQRLYGNELGQAVSNYVSGLSNRNWIEAARSAEELAEVIVRTLESDTLKTKVTKIKDLLLDLDMKRRQAGTYKPSRITTLMGASPHSNSILEP